MSEQPALIVGIVIVACLYAAVGHGGASGYLALLAFTAVPTKEGAALALCMNLVASAISFFAFQRSKHFDFKLAWPFLVGSIPFAFLGGSLKMPGHVHKWVLAAVLLVTGLILIARAPRSTAPSEPRVPWMILIGGAVGLVSGIVGVGGGIFLSPILILTGWATAKRSAAVSALFIFCNSAAGLAARGGSVNKVLTDHWPLLIAGLVGAVMGAWLGSTRISNPGLRRLLGLVLLFVVVKLAS